MGIRGGVTILRRVSIGGMMMWLLNPADAGKTEFGQRQRLNMNYGGVLLDVVFARTQRIDFTLEGVLGGGGACRESAENGSCFAKTSFFFGQPGAAVHVRVSPIVRLMFGLGYRLVAAKAWDGPGSRQLGAPVGTFMLELGWF